MTRAGLLSALAIAAAILVTIVYRERIDVDALVAWIAGFGMLAPAVFCLARIVGAVLLVPGSVMAVAAGVLFGFVGGSIYNLVSSTAGAILAFAIARHIVPGRIRDWLPRDGLLTRLVDGVEAEGWRFVAFVRLVPLFPYNVLNYALGLTRIRLSHYSLATLVCMIPGDLAYVWTGYAAREALGGNERSLQLGLYALGALAALAFVPRLARRIRASRGRPKESLDE